MIVLSGLSESEAVTRAKEVIDIGQQVATERVCVDKVATSQWEPYFVAALCASMVPLVRALRPLVEIANPGTTLNLATVFTHQSPLVRKPVAAACELADLLIAVIDRRSGSEKGVAALVQAKCSDTTMCKLGGTSELTQFDLLADPGPFNLAKPLVKGYQFDLRGRLDSEKYTALHYGICPPAGTDCEKTRTALSSYAVARPRWRLTGSKLSSLRPIDARRCLATHIVSMLQARAGWDFITATSPNYWQALYPRDHWSALINFLLEQTGSTNTETLKRLKPGNPKRGAEHSFLGFATLPSGEIQRLIVDTHAAKGQPVQAPGWFHDGIRAGEPVSWMPSQEFERDSGGGGPPLTDKRSHDEEGGPISAIVFEIVSKKER